MTSTTNLILDTVKPSVPPFIWAKVGDQNSRYVVISVAVNGIAQAIPTTASVSLSMIRVDGATNSISGIITQDGEAQILLPQWLTDIGGLCQACLKISEDNQILHTFNFQIFVEESGSTDKTIIWYNYNSALSPNTYYLIRDNAPISFTLSIALPVGGVVVLNSDNTLTTYETQSLQSVIESNIPAIDQIAGNLLSTNALISEICQDATAVPGDIAEGKTAYGATGKMVGTKQNITKQIIERSATTLAADDFDHCTRIGAYVFQQYSTLQAVTLPDTVILIEDLAFKSCSALEEVNLSEGLTSIGTQAFSECVALSRITFPESLITLSSNAFASCRGLTNIIIPDNVTYIGPSVFSYCNHLQSVTLGNGINMILNSAFNTCTALSNINFRGTIATIDSYAFQSCTALSAIDLSNVTSLGQRTFESCGSLLYADMPNIISIGMGAFNGCTNLLSINIGSTIGQIYGDAFKNCSSLISITIHATTPPPLSNIGALQNTNNCPIYVPATSVDVYKGATNWSTYASRIQAIQE